MGHWLSNTNPDSMIEEWKGELEMKNVNISQYISIYQKPKQTDKNKQTPIILMVKRILIMIEIKKNYF